MPKVTGLNQHKKNKVDKNFLDAYTKAGGKVRQIPEGDAKKMGIRIESKPGDVMGRIVHDTSPLTKARSHLDKETERGDHSPQVGGHGTSQHGGRVSTEEMDRLDSQKHGKVPYPHTALGNPDFRGSESKAYPHTSKGKPDFRGEQ